ncbi:amidoligase family protein [Thermodesulfobacteriota bacterium]
MTNETAEFFQTPPVLENESGSVRKVGFELELAGVGLEAIASAVADLFGGHVGQESPFLYKVSDTRLGDFTIEVDSSLLKDRRYKEFLSNIGVELESEEQEALEKVMLDAASVAVPFEIVFPPVTITELENLIPLEQALRDRHAEGTRASFLYAFGMQFNPEVPSLEANTILAYLRAFFLLLEWLKEEINTDFTRRILPFIDDFPEEYVRLVLDPEYEPGFKRLVDDYVSFNPTRNRPLDLMPLFAHVDSSAIVSKVKDAHLVKPRPTFHYRLPDCRIDEPDWSMALEWNRWVRVEELAQDSSALRELSQDRLERKEGLHGWIERLSQWINPRKSQSSE